jgi:hypothetical protein
MRPLDPTSSASPARCAFYATREDERAIEEIAKLRYPNRPFVTKSAIVRAKRSSLLRRRLLKPRKRSAPQV